MANVSLEAFRTIRVVDAGGVTTNIIADQSEDVVTFVAGANIQLSVIEDDRVIVSAQSPIGFTGSVGFRGFSEDRGHKDFRDHRVTEVTLVLRVEQVLQAHMDTLVALALLDHKVIRAM